MYHFDELWTLLRQHGSSNKREAECAQLWETYSPELRNLLYETIRTPPNPTPRSTPLSDKEIAARQLFSIASTVTKHRIEAGDRRRRPEIFKEVYAALKTQLYRDRNGGGTEAIRMRVLTK